MGKRRHNAKARQVVKTTIDNKDTTEIRHEFSNGEYGQNHDSMPLVLPSKKRKTGIIKEKHKKTQFLTKAQRKRLEKIVDKKKKKDNRAKLLESLSQVQATPEEMQHMTAISTIQSLGRKKIDQLNTPIVSQIENGKGTNKRKNNGRFRAAKKRLRLLKLKNNEVKEKPTFIPNAVGLESFSSTSSDSDDDNPSKISDQTDDKKQENQTSKCDVTKGDAKVNNDKKQENQTSKCDVTKGDAKVDNGVIVINSDSEEINKTNIKTDKSKGDKTQNLKELPTNVKPVLKYPTEHVIVERDPKIQVARLELPILAEEQNIMELINENEIVIISGETGSGKTTQIPQFLYEAGYARNKMIGITEPRRVATMAMAARVGYEMGLSNNEVSYLIRFEGNVTKDTRIKFMTDGVLLKEMEQDFLLSKYSVIILDEAHERSVHTDILLGLLSIAVPKRNKTTKSPLRLIIMSATLRIEDFTDNKKLFKIPPPVINIESRQFPITIHFIKLTHSDYLKDAYSKTVKIHTRLPDGGILIFVTGQQEIHYLVKKLQNAFPYKRTDYSKLIEKNKVATNTTQDSETYDIDSDDDAIEREMKRKLSAKRISERKLKMFPKIKLSNYDMDHDDYKDSDGDSEDDLDSASDTEDQSLAYSIRSCTQPLWVLPLYSKLESQKQRQVFRRAPVGTRLCVVSTDVAETSLTIPGIKYVVDTGKKKMKLYDQVTGVSAWRVVWTSKASAEQRAGRSGRSGPGHVYRLYSSAVYQHQLVEQYEPELCRRPLDDLVLLMKNMNINKVENFPYPTAPNRLNLRMAEKRLHILDLLEKIHLKTGDEGYKITPLGKSVADFSLPPRFAKMLALGNQGNLLEYVVLLVSALSVPEVFSEYKVDQWPANLRNILLMGDLGILMRAVHAAELAFFKGEGPSFLARHGLREKAILEIRKLRRQLTNDLNTNVKEIEIRVDPEMKEPDDKQFHCLRQLIVCGLGDQVARKIGFDEVPKGAKLTKYKYAYRCTQLMETVYLHSESIMRKVIPEWVVYQELYETGEGDQKKNILRNITAIEPEWLYTYVPNLCNMGDPLTEPEPRFDSVSGTVKCHFKGTFGQANWELPKVEIDFPDCLEKYSWFGRFLLEGVVCPKLKKFKSSLLSPPTTMIKSWAKLQQRTQTLLKALANRSIGDRDALTKIWNEQPKYLLDEYLTWLPVSAHNDCYSLWPPK